MLKKFECFNSSRGKLMIGNWGVGGLGSQTIRGWEKNGWKSIEVGDKLVPSFDRLFEQCLIDFKLLFDYSLINFGSILANLAPSWLQVGVNLGLVGPKVASSWL